MNRAKMREFMPHRGLNQLIDEYRDTGEGAGEGRLRIAPEDPLGRDLFLSRGAEPRYLAPFLLEHAALVSLLVIREEMTGGRLAYFSTVSRFRHEGDAPAGTPLVSHVRRGRDRGEFRNFDLRVETETGGPVLRASFMAYLAPEGASEPGAAQPDHPDLASEDLPADPGLFPGFAPSLALVAPDASGSCRGIYPWRHPHVPGHFPGAPVMMGMAQWLAVAQAASLLAGPGESELTGGGRLVKGEGTVVAEVAGLRVMVDRAGDRVNDLRILATKRVAFRERIVPGDAYTAEFEPA